MSLAVGDQVDRLQFELQDGVEPRRPRVEVGGARFAVGVPLADDLQQLLLAGDIDGGDPDPILLPKTESSRIFKSDAPPPAWLDKQNFFIIGTK